MRYSTAVALLAGTAAAFPAMSGDTKAMMEGVLRQSEHQKREASPVAEADPQLLSGILDPVLGGLNQVIQGLSGSLAEGILNPDDRRPEPGYVFQEPKAGDSRGPCPGLNLLANYGYLPRNGYVHFDEVLTATAQGFNMSPELATVLSVFAILANGNISEQSFWLGTDPVSGVGGLNRHSTVEADVSPNREDFYTGCGDNHHLSSRLFKRNVAFAAADPLKQFTLDAMGNQYAALAAESKKNNPYLYAFPFPQIVSLGAFVFYPNFFSNGTYGLGGVANYESISSIIGAQYDSKTDQFKYVPERWPENWYRRSVPFGAVATLAEGYLNIYPKNIIVPGASSLLTPNFNTTTIMCEIYQGINSITPLFLAGDVADVASATEWALGKLSSVFPAGTFLGCPVNTLSPNTPGYSGLYQNADQVGGPINPPPAQVKWTGNNVYNKFYFKTQPTSPACSH